MSLISILIPVFNVEEYIQECLKSVLRQSYTNYELVIVNDGCSDNTMDLVHSFVLQNHLVDKVNVINNSENLGIARSRNICIENAKGEYIFFLDSDDRLEEDCLRILYANAIETGAELIQSNFRCEPYPWKQFVNLNNYSGDTVLNDNAVIRRLMLERKQLPIMIWNRLIKRNFIIANGLYFKDGVIFEDEHWNFFLSKKLSKVSIVKNITYIYNNNTGGITRRYHDTPYAQYSIREIIKDYVNSIDEPYVNHQINLLYYHIYYYDYELVEIILSVYRSSLVQGIYKQFLSLHRRKIISQKLLIYISRAYIKLIRLISPAVRINSNMRNI